MQMSKNCEQCKNEFFPRKDKISKARFCSRMCLYKATGSITKNVWINRYEKWSKESREIYIPIMKESFERFINRDQECWLWTGSGKGNNRTLNYGSFYFRGKDLIAHRASYVIYKGEIPDDMLVLHSCDIPRCVNPDHLWVGTYLDNERDKVAKGRHKGEKLNQEKVKELKSLMRSDYGDMNLARKYGVSYQTIWSIRTGRTWKDIE